MSIVFIGQSLAPFYVYDPRRDAAIVGPSLEAIKTLDAPTAAAEWPFVKTEEALPALQLMQAGLAEGLDSESLTWEYRRLFVGPAKKPAPPWGSVYLDKDQVMFGWSTIELNEWLRFHGISFDCKGLPVDHIGTMLELMAWIAQNKPENLEEFLQDHFFTWSSHFLEELEEAAEQSFYQGLALLTRLSLEGIAEVLNIEPKKCRFYR